MLIRRTIVPVLFLVLLVGCESTTGPAGFPDEELVPVTVRAPAPADGEGLTAQGFPYKPDGTMPVTEMVLWFSQDGITLSFDSNNMAVNYEDGTTYSQVTILPGDAITLWLPPGEITVEHSGRWEANAYESYDYYLTYNVERFEVPTTSEILLRPRGALAEIQMETVPAVDYVGPGDVIDVMVTPIGIDGVSVLPYNDFEVTFDAPGSSGVPTGTILHSSNLGARVQVAEDATTLTVKVNFEGWIHTTKQDGTRDIERTSMHEYLFVPVRSSAEITTDAERPIGMIDGHDAGVASNGMVPVRFYGSVDTHPTEIQLLRLYEGPKLIASTDSADGVAAINFPTSSSGGLHFWDTASIGFADGQSHTVKLQVVDQATNEHVSDYTLDLR